MSTLYGLEQQERLVTEIEDVIESVLDNACEKPGESFDTIADRIAWPIEVFEYRPVDVTCMAVFIAEMALEEALERLDEEHADPDGDETEPTQRMKDAAAAFAQAVVEDYVPWACEPTGKIISVSRDEAKKMLGDR